MKKLSYLFVTLLIGAVIGCGSSNPLADEASSSIEDQNYKAALESAEKSIEKYPQDPLGYYYKGVALGELAGDFEDPQKSTEYYKRMNEAFEQAREVAKKAEEVPGEIERISAVKNVLWQSEHNRAVKLATDDSLKKTVSNPLKNAMNHLQNATVIQPDSALSWDVLAQVAAMNKEFKEAANAKSKYIGMVQDTTLKPNDYMQLAQYYFQLDQQEQVLSTLQKAQQQFPENEQIVSNLADAYMRTGHPKKSISTVQKLVDQDPKNPQYHLVLGTQIYQQALVLTDSLQANSNQIFDLKQKLKNTSGSESEAIKQEISTLSQQNAQLQTRIKELTNRAEKELQMVLESRPNDASAYNTLGIIYQNRAKAIFDQRNRTTDNEEAAALDKKGREMLKKSMEYYEKATEIEPDNQEYWKSLFSIYTALGMDQKAQEAMKKAGMNN